MRLLPSFATATCLIVAYACGDDPENALPTGSEDASSPGQDAAAGSTTNGPNAMGGSGGATQGDAMAQPPTLPDAATGTPGAEAGPDSGSGDAATFNPMDASTSADAGVSTDAGSQATDAGADAGDAGGGPSGETCSEAKPLLTGITVNGDTSGHIDDYASAGGACNLGFGEPDDVYVFVVPMNGTLTVTLTSAQDLGLHMRNASNATDCANDTFEVDCIDNSFGGGAEVISGTVTAGQTFYIFVDGCESNCSPTGAEGAYSLIATM